MSTRNRTALVSLILMFATLLGRALANENPARANDKKPLTVTEKESGTKVKLSKGDALVVRLEMQSGTAFGWKVAKNDDKVLKAPAKPDLERPEKPKPGGKATQVFRFSAASAGTIELEMHYVRPFDKDKAPAKVFKLKVTVE